MLKVEIERFLFCVQPVSDVAPPHHTSPGQRSKPCTCHARHAVDPGPLQDDRGGNCGGCHALRRAAALGPFNGAPPSNVWPPPRKCRAGITTPTTAKIAQSGLHPTIQLAATGTASGRIGMEVACQPRDGHPRRPPRRPRPRPRRLLGPSASKTGWVPLTSRSRTSSATWSVGTAKWAKPACTPSHPSVIPCVEQLSALPPVALSLWPQPCLQP